MYKTLLFISFVAMTLAASRVPDQGLGVFEGDKILVELYYETQCPYCTQYITGQLNDVITVQGIFDIANFQLYPFGNGKVIKNGRDHTFTCQHGQTECQGNMVASCALNMYEQSMSVPFAACLQHQSNNWRSLGQTCAQQFGLDWSQIESCTNSYEGQQAQYYAALATKAAGIKSVPTLYVDGVEEESYNFDMRGNLLEYICTAYKGSNVIEACKKF